MPNCIVTKFLFLARDFSLFSLSVPFPLISSCHVRTRKSCFIEGDFMISAVPLLSDWAHCIWFTTFVKGRGGGSLIINGRKKWISLLSSWLIVGWFFIDYFCVGENDFLVLPVLYKFLNSFQPSPFPFSFASINIQPRNQFLNPPIFMLFWYFVFFVTFFYKLRCFLVYRIILTSKSKMLNRIKKMNEVKLCLFQTLRYFSLLK